MNSGRLSLPSIDSPVINLEVDTRWQLVQRVLASKHFSKAPLLSKFLSHICAETLQGHNSQISEYQIGVQVFDRKPNYRTVEDNIVRNYARQLRRRLTDYFDGEGRNEPLRIEIPLGGYVPIFPTTPQNIKTPEPLKQEPHVSHPILVVGPARGNMPEPGREQTETPSVLKWNVRLPLRIALFALYSIILVAIAISATHWITAARTTSSPSSPLWDSLFNSRLDTVVVPADCGFNILEDLSHKKIALASYINNDYMNLALPAVDVHSASDLRTQQFTSFVDLKIVTKLARLPQVTPEKFLVRFPRELHLDDLKSSNVILIGSNGSNPWSEIAQHNLSFQIVYSNEMDSAWIENSHPRDGEQRRYVSRWNEPTHSTYAVVAYEPNFAGNGHVLLIEGLDVAGTQAAADALLRDNVLSPVLQQATNGKELRPFEVLLQSTSIASNAASTQLIAYRIH